MTSGRVCLALGAGLVMLLVAVQARDSGAPATRVAVARDVYHGVTVEDPYRWLEDGANQEVRTWVAAAAAAQKMGGPRAELRYYHLVPEWITGMGIVVGQA